MTRPIPRPLIKWAGGKTQLCDEIVSRMPQEIDTYCEPYFGGGAVFFRLMRGRRIKGKSFIYDANEDIKHLYFQVRLHPEALIRELSLVIGHASTGGRITLEGYNSVRARFDLILPAARFLFLNKTCVNGLYRVNKAGEFNVSWGKVKHLKIDVDNIMAVSEALQNTTWGICEHECVCYIDPPYFPKSKTANFTAYSSGGFKLSDQLDALALGVKCAEKGGLAIMSQADVPIARELYGAIPNAKVETVTAKRRISCKEKGRADVTELLVTIDGRKKKDQ